MSDTKSVTFSIDRHDKDGDSWETGIYLHFGNASIKVAEDIEGYKEFTAKLEHMTVEIADNLGIVL